MSPITRLVRAYPFLSFAVLDCLFGWGVYIAAAFGLGTNPDNMPLGPLFAALVVASMQGREALREWGRRLRSWGWLIGQAATWRQPTGHLPML